MQYQLYTIAEKESFLFFFHMQYKIPIFKNRNVSFQHTSQNYLTWNPDCTNYLYLAPLKKLRYRKVSVDYHVTKFHSIDSPALSKAKSCCSRQLQHYKRPGGQTQHPAHISLLAVWIYGVGNSFGTLQLSAFTHWTFSKQLRSNPCFDLQTISF